MSIYSIGVSGLNAARSALGTTSNNISNVFTPGHSRVSPTLTQNGADLGVTVTGGLRHFNQFVSNQLNASTNRTSALTEYETQISQINNLLADREAGLSPLVQNFFSSVEDLAANPADPASRQGVLGTANIMTAQFRAFDQYLYDIQDGLNQQIEEEVTQVNNLITEVASLNREISTARASRGEAPNGLLDQRDQAISQLSERLNVRLNIQDGRTYNIALPNGEPLVTTFETAKLVTMKAPNDPQRTIIGYEPSTGAVRELRPIDESLITGGSLGGLMTFRAETLDKTQSQIGLLATSLAVAFNEQQAVGRDLNGDVGDELFSVDPPLTYADERNDGFAEIERAEFDIENIDQLRATDYQIRVIGTGAPPGAADFEIIRKDSGETLDSSDFVLDDPNPGNLNATLSFGGVTVTFDDLNELRQYDRFEVQPLRRAAAGMENLIDDIDKVAAGAALAEVDGSSDMEVSAVSTVVGGFAEDSHYAFSLTDAGEMTITSATVPSEVLINGETRAVDAGGVIQDSATAGAPAALVAGDTVTIDGVSFTVEALPEATGSPTTLELDERAAPGDNRNALAMQNLQAEAIVSGLATFSQAYGGMVSDVGNQTNIVQVNLEASRGITEQLDALKQSESGVNLDEEAANLLRYQQFYAANARVIDTASTMFDTILGLRG